MDPEEQHRLVERARRGDAQAWVGLYRHAYTRLRAYAVRHGGYDVAEDLVSETMARAVAGIDGYQRQAVGFDGWLFGILRRVCADHHRGRTKPTRGYAGSGVEPDRCDEDLLRAEEHIEVRRAFGRLNREERHVLELRVIGGLPAEDVAHVLGKRPGAVRTAQSRALAHLRELMGEDR